jgi:hypothetical protein
MRIVQSEPAPENVSVHKSERQVRYVIATAIIALPLVYFYPAVFGQVILAPGDGWTQNFPVRAFAGAELGRGQFALWNPFIFGGMPLLASVYAGALYPPNWLFALLPPVIAQNLVVITTYHLALIGVYRLARQLGYERLAALLSGLAFSFGGFMIAHLAHTSRIAAAAWLPWVLLAIEQLRSASRQGWRTPALWRWTALAAVFAALQFLAGEPQMFVFTLLVGAIYLLFALFTLPDWAARRRLLSALSVASGVGLLLVLPQLLPTLELLAQSERRDPGPAFLDPYSLPPWQLPALLFPYFFGGGMRKPFTVPYWGADISGVACGYVGILTWLASFASLKAAQVNNAGESKYLVEENKVQQKRQEEAKKAGKFFTYFCRLWFSLPGTSMERSASAFEQERMPFYLQGRLWLTVAVVALLLAFGGYLPFKINHFFYAIPGYGSFRGLYRHQYELTFALAMSGGLGLTQWLRQPHHERLRILWRCAGWLGCLLLVNVGLYVWAAARLASQPLPPRANAIGNPELWVPLLCFLVTIAALWWRLSAGDSHCQSTICLLLVLLLDLASYGHFYHWRTAGYDVTARLQDPPAVQAIKQREPDLTAFRVMSQPLLADDYAAAWPDDLNYEAINQPNFSMLRGLQSASGNDVLRPVRTGELLGSAGSVLQGFVQDPGVFGLTDRRLDLLNVKYLLVGRGGANGQPWPLRYAGIDFASTNLALLFTNGKTVTTDAAGAATELALVTTMANSTHLPDGAPVLHLKLHARDGRVIEQTLLAGRDTSEWAYGRADVSAAVQHQRAAVVEQLPRHEAGKSFESYHYLARLDFPRAEIERIEWRYARSDAALYVIRASLYDAVTQQATPLSAFHFPAERWRKLGVYGQVTLFENQRVLPRAWFVKEVKTLPPADILTTIKTSQSPDGETFDPHSIALLAQAGAARKLNEATEATVQVTHLSPRQIGLQTRNPQAGFLVLAETWYAGWQAHIDGQAARLVRTNYHLRGLAIPPGEHRVTLSYTPASWRNGLGGLAAGVAVLLALWAASRRLASFHQK